MSINAQEMSLFNCLFWKKLSGFRKVSPACCPFPMVFSRTTSVKHRSAVLFYLPGKISFLLVVTLPLDDFRVQIPGGVVNIWQSRP